jgi:hypothetical protein
LMDGLLLVQWMCGQWGYFFMRCAQESIFYCDMLYICICFYLLLFVVLCCVVWCGIIWYFMKKRKGR